MIIVAGITTLEPPFTFPIRCPEAPDLHRNEDSEVAGVIPDPVYANGVGPLFSRHLILDRKANAVDQRVVSRIVAARFGVVGDPERYAAVGRYQNKMMEHDIVPYRDG